MSMLSSMTEKMCETAHEVKRFKDNNTDWLLWRDAITLNDAVRELRDAADTIDGLRSMCNDLQTECGKLRELVSVVYGYYASGTINPCDICDSIGCQYVGEAESGCRYRDRFDRAEAAGDEIQRRMSDLGVDVD